MAGISIFIFGNKRDDSGSIISAKGVMREFEIAVTQGLIPIPVALTGYVAKEIHDLIMKNPEYYYEGVEQIPPLLAELTDGNLTDTAIIDKIIKCLFR